MRAITILPGVPNSARLDEVGEPSETDGRILVRTRALGICGTDYEILEGLYGAAPRGEERLILGHESLGIVEEAPAESGFRRGDHVVGIVRRPDPVPCPACAVGRMGHVPQRALHRARHQGAARLRCRTFPHRAGIRGEGRSRARSSGGADGACERRRQGLGACVPDRRALAVLGARAMFWSPAPARSACWPRWSACSTDCRCMSSIATRTERSRSSSRDLGGTYHHSWARSAR